MVSSPLLLVVLALLVCGAVADGEENRRKTEGWFCPKRKDCPEFKVLKDQGPYQLRHYSRSTWAVSCAHDVHRPEGVLRATSRLLQYIKEEKLWGGAPLAQVVHLSLGNLQTWNASMLAGSLEEGSAENCMHKTICAAYFLPSKYQASETASGGGDADAEDADVDRRPPKPSKKSGVFIARIHGFDAYVSGFPGFPTPPKFIFEHMRLLHNLKWDHEEFRWNVASFLIYNSPAETDHRWNEVLVPAGSSSNSLGEMLLEGNDLFAAEEGEVVDA